MRHLQRPLIPFALIDIMDKFMHIVDLPTFLFLAFFTSIACEQQIEIESACRLQSLDEFTFPFFLHRIIFSVFLCVLPQFFSFLLLPPTIVFDGNSRASNTDRFLFTRLISLTPLFLF